MTFGESSFHWAKEVITRSYNLGIVENFILCFTPERFSAADFTQNLYFEDGNFVQYTV